MSIDGPLARLSAFVRSASSLSVQALTAGRPLAVGWATVELDRAVAEVGAALRIPVDRFVDAADSSQLGARCLVARGILEDDVSLVLLEPNMEGRLAATLARHDEGPAAVWLAVGNLFEAAAAMRTGGRGTSVAQAGPLGPERFVDGPIHGPHLFLVEQPGTIRT